MSYGGMTARKGAPRKGRSGRARPYEDWLHWDPSRGTSAVKKGDPKATFPEPPHGENNIGGRSKPGQP